LKIIGCYAQTELRGGSNVAGLETTATLDMKTDEWVIHTPTIRATKFWPGGMGLGANHAMVYARCITGDKDHGVQAFLVPIRDANHKSFDSVKNGDLGAKLGWEGVDNGWLTFTQHRVPRYNMMSRFASVDKAGTFEIRGDQRMRYSIMVATRIGLTKSAGQYL